MVSNCSQIEFAKMANDTIGWFGWKLSGQLLIADMQFSHKGIGYTVFQKVYSVASWAFMCSIPFTKRIFIKDILVFSLSSEPEPFLVGRRFPGFEQFLTDINHNWNIWYEHSHLWNHYHTLTLQAIPLHTVSTFIIAVVIRHNQKIFQKQ